MSAKILNASGLLLTSGIAFKISSVSAEGEQSLIAIDPNHPEYRINLLQLESHLQTIRKDIYDQKCELQLCVTELLYKQEIAQRTELHQKVEACLADINVLKDFIYSDRSSSSSHRNNQQDKVLVLRGEIENVKSAVRRMELQQCEQLDVFARLKRIEFAHQSHVTDFSTYRQSDIFAPVRELIQQTKRDIESSLEQMKNDFATKLASTDFKITNLENMLKNEHKGKLVELEEDIGEVAHGLKQVEVSFHDQCEALSRAVQSQTKAINNITNSVQTNTSVISQLCSGNIAVTQAQSPIAILEDGSNSSDPAILLPNNYLALSQNSLRLDSPSIDLLHPTPNVATAPSPSINTPGNVTYTPIKRQPSNGTGAILTPNKDRAGASFTSTNSLRALNRPVAVNIDSLKVEFASLKSVEALTADIVTMRRDLDKQQEKTQLLRGKAIFTIIRKTFRRYFEAQAKRRFQHLVLYNQIMKERELEHKKMKLEHLFAQLISNSVTSNLQHAFHQWKNNAERIAKFAHIHKWCKAKLTPYWQSYEPDLVEYVGRWKRFVVDSYKGYLFDEDQAEAEKAGNDLEKRGMIRNESEGEGVGGGEVAVKKANKSEARKKRGSFGSADLRSSLDALAGQNFSVQNIKKVAYDDLQMRWAFQEQKDELAELNFAFQQTMHNSITTQLSQYKQDIFANITLETGRLFKSVKQIEDEFVGMKKNIANSLTTLSEEKIEIYEKLDSQMNKLSSSLAQYKSQVTVKMSYMKEELDESYRVLQGNVDQYVHRIVVLEDYQKGYEDDKQKFIKEIEKFDMKVQAIWLNCEDMNQYLLIYKEQAATFRNDINVLINKHNQLNNDLQEEKKVNAEQHHYIDEEIKWMKNIITEQYQSFTSLKDATNHELNSMRILLNQQEDPEQMLGEYADLCKEYLELGKKFIYYQYSTHYILPKHPHKTSQHKPQNMNNKLYSKEYYEILLSISKLCRKMHVFITTYSDQEYVLHHLNTYLQPSHLQYDYNNHFVQLYSQPELIVDKLRLKLVQKCLKDLEQSLQSYLQSALHEEHIVFYLPRNTPFTVNTKELAVLKTSYLYAVRNVLGCYMSQYRSIHIPTGSPLVTHNQPEQEYSSHLVKAYKSFRQSSPPRRVHYTINKSNRPSTAPLHPMSRSVSTPSIQPMKPSEMALLHLESQSAELSQTEESSVLMGSVGRDLVSRLKTHLEESRDSSRKNSGQESPGGGMKRMQVDLFLENKPREEVTEAEYPVDDSGDEGDEMSLPLPTLPLQALDSAVIDQYLPNEPGSSPLKHSHVNNTQHIALNTIVQQSAQQQRELVDFLAHSFPKDVSIRPKHNEAEANEKVEEYAGLTARPLVGKNQIPR